MFSDPRPQPAPIAASAPLPKICSTTLTGRNRASPVRHRPRRQAIAPPKKGAIVFVCLISSLRVAPLALSSPVASLFSLPFFRLSCPARPLRTTWGAHSGASFEDKPRRISGSLWWQASLAFVVVFCVAARPLLRGGRAGSANGEVLTLPSLSRCGGVRRGFPILQGQRDKHRIDRSGLIFPMESGLRFRCFPVKPTRSCRGRVLTQPVRSRHRRQSDSPDRSRPQRTRPS